MYNGAINVLCTINLLTKLVILSLWIQYDSISKTIIYITDLHNELDQKHKIINGGNFMYIIFKNINYSIEM